MDSDGKVRPGIHFDAKVLKVRYRHQDTNGKLMKHIYTARDTEGHLLRWALVSYKWGRCQPFEFLPSKDRGSEYGPEGASQMKRKLEPEEYEK